MANFRTGSLFFYIVKQGKNIFFYIKKVWQSTLFYPFLVRGSIFFPTAFDFVSFGIVFGVSYNYGPKLKVYLSAFKKKKVIFNYIQS